MTTVQPYFNPGCNLKTLRLSTLRVMAGDQKLPVRTASREQSVWKDLNENEFRRNVIELEKVSNEVPRDPKVYTQDNWLARGTRTVEAMHTLPFGVEQQLADDLAFIAAAEEGVKAVSAIGIEEADEHRGLIVRLAANDVIPGNVPRTLEMMFHIVKQCAMKSMPILFNISSCGFLPLR
jgi:hypothetical protein